MTLETRRVNFEDGYAQGRCDSLQELTKIVRDDFSDSSDGLPGPSALW